MYNVKTERKTKKNKIKDKNTYNKRNKKSKIKTAMIKYGIKIWKVNKGNDEYSVNLTKEEADYVITFKNNQKIWIIILKPQIKKIINNNFDNKINKENKNIFYVNKKIDFDDMENIFIKNINNKKIHLYSLIYYNSF